MWSFLVRTKKSAFKSVENSAFEAERIQPLKQKEFGLYNWLEASKWRSSMPVISVEVSPIQPNDCCCAV